MKKPELEKMKKINEIEEQLESLTLDEVYELAKVGLQLLEEAVYTGTICDSLGQPELGNMFNAIPYELADVYDGTTLERELAKCFVRASKRVDELAEEIGDEYLG